MGMGTDAILSYVSSDVLSLSRTELSQSFEDIPSYSTSRDNRIGKKKYKT